MNVNELIIDRISSAVISDIGDGSMIARISKIENPSLKTAAEGEDVTDALGSVISTLYRAKTGEFSATNSLFSTDLLAMQYGTDKEIASNENKIIASAEESLTVEDGKVQLKHTPTDGLKYIYSWGGSLFSKKYTKGASVSESEFTINDNEITVPTGVTGKIYVEYDYETTSAVVLENNTTKFPKTVMLKLFVIFKDPCNDNIVRAGTIIGQRAKLDANVDMELTSKGKHPFTFKFQNDYCSDNDSLFKVIIAED